MTDSDQWGVMPDDGYDLHFSFDELLAYNDDRRARDVLGTETPEREFVDIQFDSALAYVVEKLEAPESEGDAEASEGDPGEASASVDDEAAEDVTDGDEDPPQPEEDSEGDTEAGEDEPAEEPIEPESTEVESPQSRVHPPLNDLIEGLSPRVEIIPRPQPRAA